MDVSSSYKSNQTDKVDIKALLPLLGVRIGDFSNLAEQSVVEDQSVELSKGADGLVDSLLSYGKVCQITIQHCNLVAVLLLELLQRLDTAGYHHHIVGLGCCEEVFGHSKADTWMWDVSIVLFADDAGILPLEAPVTMIVLAIMY